MRVHLRAGPSGAKWEIVNKGKKPGIKEHRRKSRAARREDKFPRNHDIFCWSSSSSSSVSFSSRTIVAARPRTRGKKAGWTIAPSTILLCRRGRHRALVLFVVGGKAHARKRDIPKRGGGRWKWLRGEETARKVCRRFLLSATDIIGAAAHRITRTITRTKKQHHGRRQCERGGRKALRKSWSSIGLARSPFGFSCDNTWIPHWAW